MPQPSDLSIDHHIQLHILRQMITRPASRYSELKPVSVEANLFMYHLNQLIRLGLIIKKDKIYFLTRHGKHFADRANLSSMKIRLQPKCITILTVQNEAGEWLILKRKHQPFIDYKGFPSGKIHYGETLLQAAQRELLEKSGLTGIDLELQGNVVMRFTDTQTTVNHIIGYVFGGKVPDSASFGFDHEHFSCYFGPESELFNAPYFEGHQQILQLLKGPTPFIAEHQFTSDY